MKDPNIAWPEYRALCDRADVFTRWSLQQTITLLKHYQHDLLGESLAHILLELPNPKPPDHRGDDRVDTFVLNLKAESVAQIGRVLEQAQADGTVPPGISQGDLGGLAVAWREYGDLLASVARA